MRLTDLRLRIDLRKDGTYVTLTEVDRALLHADGLAARLDLKSQPLGKESLLRHLATQGKRLSKGAIPGNVMSALTSALSRGRVRLWLEVPEGEARALPWEFLHVNGPGDGYLACHPLVSVIRGTPGPLLRLGRHDNLKILLVSANPGSPLHPPLASIEAEMRSIRRAMDARECDRFEIHELRHARRDSLLADIQELRPDILHFVGHGIASGNCGALVLEAASRRHEYLYGDELGAALGGAKTRLVFLSSCFTAGATASVGQAISESARATVIGMQCGIRDTTAHHFARAVYAALCDGEPVDQAVQQGRAAISGCGHECGVPVLIAGTEPPAPSDSEAPPDRLNYPPDPRPFVGRMRQRQDLWAKLRDPKVRMATVFGIGGMGKTRLAKQVGEDLQFDFRNGVRLVECDVLQGRDELLGAIAKAADIQGATNPAELAKQLQDSQLLLLIDCFEKLVSHADVLDKIIRHAPGVKILVTSRIVLESDWEHPYELKELAKAKTKSAVLSERIELFLDAARQASPTFSFGPHNRQVVEELVDLLQGVPLALLLAAGRLRHRTLEELHERLREKLLDELKKPSNKADRHASIRIVIQDSFDLLTEQEKKLAVRLSVFPGGFTMNDAKAVISDDPEIEDGIGRLYDQSLLCSTEEGSERRYRELDTVREYMTERASTPDMWLAGRRRTPSEHGQVILKHASYFAKKAQALRQLFDQGKVSEAGESLWRDIGNFRAAIRTAKLAKDYDLMASLAKSLARAFLEAGIQSDFAMMARVADEVARQRNDLPLLIELRGLQGAQARRQGDYEKAERLWRERATQCNQVGDVNAEADSLMDIADMALASGDLPKVASLLAAYKQLDSSLIDASIYGGALLIEARMHLESGNRQMFQEAAASVEALAEQQSPHNQSTLYIRIALAKLYRVAGLASQGKKHCTQMIRDSLTARLPHFVGKGCLELSHICEQLNEHVMASQAIALACAISDSEARDLRRTSYARRSQMTQAGICSDHRLGSDKTLKRTWREAIPIMLAQ